MFSNVALKILFGVLVTRHIWSFSCNDVLVPRFFKLLYFEIAFSVFEQRSRCFEPRLEEVFAFKNFSRKEKRSIVNTIKEI